MKKASSNVKPSSAARKQNNVPKKSTRIGWAKHDPPSEFVEEEYLIQKYHHLSDEIKKLLKEVKPLRIQYKETEEQYFDQNDAERFFYEHFNDGRVDMKVFEQRDKSTRVIKKQQDSKELSQQIKSLANLLSPTSLTKLYKEIVESRKELLLMRENSVNLEQDITNTQGKLAVLKRSETVVQVQDQKSYINELKFRIKEEKEILDEYNSIITRSQVKTSHSDLYDYSSSNELEKLNNKLQNQVRKLTDARDRYRMVLEQQRELPERSVVFSRETRIENDLDSDDSISSESSSFETSGKRTVAVGLFKRQVSEDEIFDIFERFGTIEEIQVLKKHKQARALYYARIKYKSKKEAQKAIAIMNGKHYQEQKLNVKWANADLSASNSSDSDTDSDPGSDYKRAKKKIRKLPFKRITFDSDDDNLNVDYALPNRPNPKPKAKAITPKENKKEIEKKTEKKTEHKEEKKNKAPAYLLSESNLFSDFDSDNVPKNLKRVDADNSDIKLMLSTSSSSSLEIDEHGDVRKEDKSKKYFRQNESSDTFTITDSFPEAQIQVNESKTKTNKENDMMLNTIDSFEESPQPDSLTETDSFDLNFAPSKQTSLKKSSIKSSSSESDMFADFEKIA